MNFLLYQSKNYFTQSEFVLECIRKFIKAYFYWRSITYDFINSIISPINLLYIDVTSNPKELDLL